jgi:phage recombination protein Bet
VNPPTSAVALAPTAPGQIQSAGEMVDALNAVKAAIAPDLNPAELKLFAMVAYRSGLDPFARQIHAVKRGGKVTFQTGIDGFRSSAERTGQYDGQDEPEFGPNCDCKEQPNPHPQWARVTVYRMRNGERRPQSATAYWHEYKPAPPGDAMYKKMPRNQLAKCAEALAFRKAFPYVLADVYAPEEMAQAGQADRIIEHRPTARQAVAERRAALEVDADTGPTDDTASGTADGDDAPIVEDEAQVVEGEFVDDLEPEALELTEDAFRQRAREAGFGPARVKAAVAREFPEASGHADLTDADRGRLWQALEAEDAAGQ